MSITSITIQKHPELRDSANYELLRKKGLEYIEKLGSSIWTDYNIHDPGITILELLCYAITDLGYRTAFDIKDLLAEPVTKAKAAPARQGFFTAREILTVNPWTVADFRKLLIDIDGIKNGWLNCKECACDDLVLYANCSESKLQYQNKKGLPAVTIKGFYDVLIEFENTQTGSDLNSGKVKYNFNFKAGARASSAMIEMRLLSWEMIRSGSFAERYFGGNSAEADKFIRFIEPGTTVTNIVTQFISGNRNDNVNMPAADQARLLRRPVYATVSVTFNAGNGSPDETTMISDIPMTVWFANHADRRGITLDQIATALTDATASGIFANYHALIQQAGKAMALAKDRLHAHRNLCEDYCSIKAVPVEDIGVCADIDLEPSAELEATLAEAYYRIGQYLSPDIKFYSLQELMDKDIPVDEIFEGPQLSNGFIDNDELETTNLKQFIYASDIINLLMDIPGVKAIRNFVLTKFDEDGRLIRNEEWVMDVLPGHQPRLYIEASKLMAFKNGLPFLPDRLELNDTLQVIRGRNTQPQYSVLENDLPVPTGTFYPLEEYFPVQYSLPLTYGVGPEGLPSTASVERKAQAQQLRGYLLFYEQLLVNYLQQLKNAGELFAIDESVSATYFNKQISDQVLGGIDSIYSGTPTDLHNLVENTEEFFDRRNRFLDHMLARFAENFNEYALMLYSYSSKAFADDKLVRDKISFLQDLPFMTINRARAINYKNISGVCSKDNVAGLQVRIQRLLGMEDALGGFELYEEKDTDGKYYERRWRLKDETGKIQLSSSTRYTDEDLSESELKAHTEFNVVKKYILDASRYQIKKEKKWVVNLTDETGEVIATRKQPFKTKALAEAARDAIIEFGRRYLAKGKIFIVEHLLLRPRNKPSSLFPDGDPLLSVCLPADCAACGDQDPYSFRLTIVLSGESGIANSGIEFRRFAEQTIRAEVPAHLAVKICWVSNEQLAEFENVYCAWLSELSKDEPDAAALHNRLKELLLVFENLKSVYPDAKLHDCRDGNDSNRVFLDNTII